MYCERLVVQVKCAETEQPVEKPGCRVDVGGQGSVATEPRPLNPNAPQPSVRMSLPLLRGNPVLQSGAAVLLVRELLEGLRR